MKKKNTALELSGEQFVTKDPVFRFLRDKLGVRLTIFLTGLFAALIFLSDVLRSEPVNHGLRKFTVNVQCRVSGATTCRDHVATVAGPPTPLTCHSSEPT